jgi:sulfite exporter TauE/SafE
MQIFNDWKFWLFVIAIVKDFILVLGIILVKFNDLRHISINVEKINISLDKIFTRLGKLERHQTAMKAVCNERHPKKKR